MHSVRNEHRAKTGKDSRQESESYYLHNDVKLLLVSAIYEYEMVRLETIDPHDRSKLFHHSIVNLISIHRE